MTPYQRFRALHVPGAPLVLANAWDVASARLIEAEGAAAVATTSAGIAWSFGVADGGALDRGWTIDVVRRIVTAVDVPVTADVEDGYADDPEGVAQTIEALAATGAVGVNIEDAFPLKVWGLGIHAGSGRVDQVRQQSCPSATHRSRVAPPRTVPTLTSTA